MAGEVIAERDTWQVHQRDPDDPHRAVRGEATDGWFQSSRQQTLDDYDDDQAAIRALNNRAHRFPELEFRMVRCRTVVTVTAYRPATK